MPERVRHVIERKVQNAVSWLKSVLARSSPSHVCVVGSVEVEVAAAETGLVDEVSMVEGLDEGGEFEVRSRGSCRRSVSRKTTAVATKNTINPDRKFAPPLMGLVDSTPHMRHPRAPDKLASSQGTTSPPRLRWRPKPAHRPDRSAPSGRHGQRRKQSSAEPRSTSLVQTFRR